MNDMPGERTKGDGNGCQDRLHDLPETAQEETSQKIIGFQNSDDWRLLKAEDRIYCKNEQAKACSRAGLLFIKSQKSGKLEER